jgi:hypothetical protein
MKQILQNFKTGVLSVEEVPVPKVQPGGVLVANAFSLISAGTERSSVERLDEQAIYLIGIHGADGLAGIASLRSQ